MPLVEHALKRMHFQMDTHRKTGVTVIKLIHGYGSSGTGGKIRIQLLGTDEKDYFIRLEQKVDSTNRYKTRTEEFEEDNAEGYADGDVVTPGLNGSTVSTYRCKYSKDTGKQTDRDLIATTVYSARDEVIAKVLPKPTEPETEPTEPSEEATGPSEATEDATEPTE